MRGRFWGVVAIIGAILIVVALAVSAIFVVIGQNNDRPVGTVAFDPNTDYVPDEAKCDDNHYKDNSIRTVKAGDDEFRQFADAVSTPFKATTGEGVRAEYLTEGCGNATLLSQDVDEMLLWTDQDVPGADQNKAWLQEIKDYITANGLDAFNAKTVIGDVKIVTEKFQIYRSWVNTVWLRFTFADEAKPVVSDRNYEVSAVASPKTQPVPYVASTQDTRPSWRATLMGKNDDCIASVWLNDLDKRIVHSSEDNCKPSTPPGIDCVDCGGSPPPPVLDCPTVYPLFPHGTYPDGCKDDEGRSPFNNGNGSTGGGPAATDGPGDKTKLQDSTDTPRVDPSPPAPAPVPTSDPQPVPTAEPSAPPTSNPSQGCSPAPGETTC